MNLCSGRKLNLHEEICFDGKKCPLCEVLEKIRELENQISELEEEMEATKQ